MGQSSSSNLNNSPILANENNKPKYISIYLMGDIGEGKSNLLLRYTDDIYIDNFIPNIGMDFKLKTISIDSIEYKLQIWDIADQMRCFKTTIPSVKADGIIIVCSVKHDNIFRNIKEHVQEAERYHMKTKNTPIIVTGSKCDLEEERITKISDIKEFLEQYNIEYIETSAKDNINIDLLFQTLLCKIEDLPLPYRCRAKSARK